MSPGVPTMSSVPNVVTGIRLASVPLLWAFALAGQSVVVGVGFFLAWLTDALDGLLARWLEAESEWGSRFDSMTDTLVFLSGLAWVAMLRPDFVRDHGIILAVWLTIGATGYLVGWIRFRRIADLHLYSAKAANFMGFLFAAVLLTFGEYPAFAFYIVIAVCLVASTETLLMFATYDDVDEHEVTILTRYGFPRPPDTPS
jgi:phosphatidylglycerophosphate synthase